MSLRLPKCLQKKAFSELVQRCGVVRGSEVGKLLSSRPLIGRLLGGVGRNVSRQQGHRHESVLHVRTALQEAMSGMESRFLQVGAHLEELDASSRHLIACCERLIHLASGGDEGEQLLREATELLKGPLDYIDFCMQKQGELLKLLVQCEKQTHAMLGIRAGMHDAIAPLTYMAVMFKIESAYLTEDHRDTFLGVTSEVERLHKLVDETFALNAEQLDLAHTTLAQVRVRLESDFRAYSTVIESKRRNIGEAIKRLDEQLSHNVERDHRLQEHNERLAKEVSAIVVGVQFQDIVKQRCDHVQEALDSAEAGRMPWDATLVLQSRHLDSIKADTQQGVNSVVEGLGLIEVQTEELNRSSVSLENIESMTAAVDGMVQLLLDTFQDVSEIIGMVTELTQQGNDAVQPARGLARNLTETIKELSINMQLIALNAQIRSVQSGQGTGLELLASRTAEISSDINQISDQISDDLGRLHGAIDAMLGMFHEFKDRGETQIGELAKKRGSLEERLHALRDKTLSAVGEIGSEVDALKILIGKMTGVFDGIAGCGMRLGEAADVIQSAIGTLQFSPDEVSQLSTLLDHYTMESERAVHLEFLSKSTVGGLDGCADELIKAATEKTAAKQVDTRPPATDQACGNVELF